MALPSSRLNKVLTKMLIIFPTWSAINIKQPKNNNKTQNVDPKMSVNNTALWDNKLCTNKPILELTINSNKTSNVSQ